VFFFLFFLDLDLDGRTSTFFFSLPPPRWALSLSEFYYCFFLKRGVILTQMTNNEKSASVKVIVTKRGQVK